MQHFFARIILRIYLEPACSRLLDSGEDAEVKGTRKVGGAKKLLFLSTRFLKSAGPTISEPGTG